MSLALLMTVACGSDDHVAAVPEDCERAATEALLACFEEASTAAANCYADDGFLCDDTDTTTAAALAAAGDAIRASCTDDLVRRAGFGPQMTTDALAQRIETSCTTETASLAARTFGGPQGAVLADATADETTCLNDAYSSAIELIRLVAGAHNDCLESNTSCDSMSSGIASLQAAAANDIAAGCADLAGLIAISPPIYSERAVAQAECVTASSRTQASALGIQCGPRESLLRPPRGEYMQIVLDSDVWGTRCGDGSPFAFQLRLAPDGSPVENLMIAMEGGGVCIFENDCARISDDLFEAMDDEAPTSGIMSNDPAVSPFANWSKAFLPYCNQDVFIGGGATNVFDGGQTIHRYGAINVRAALRYIRDVIWRELDESTVEGYRPDRMRVFFGGFSAGGFGTLYNYHYVLDDLQWAHTTAFPDASVALDSGDLFSVANLGLIVIPEGGIGWAARPYLPPYCFDASCGVGPVGLASAVPRLKAVPEQQALVLTNQIDNTQVSTTFFDDTAHWVNELRFQYCEAKDEDAVHFYMPAIPESRHVISPAPDLFRGYTVDGVEMVDWLWGAVTNPNDVVNRVEEGDLVDIFPGVEPFPCEVAP